MTPYVITLHREGILRRSKKVLLKMKTRILVLIKEIVVGLITKLYGLGYTVYYTFIVYGISCRKEEHSTR